MESFIDDTLKLKEADILVFAGDNSHYPAQNKLMLEMIAERKIYKKIFVTFGNHDLYLVSNSLLKQYKYSANKIKHFKEICEEIDTVEFLDGNVVTVEGIKIGGSGLFYDFSYGIKNFYMSHEWMMKLWKDVLTDAKRIEGKDHLGHTDTIDPYGYYAPPRKYSFDPIKFFESEKEKMMKIIDDCDVFISHVGPAVPPNLSIERQCAESGFYFFDGMEYLKERIDPLLWIFGHTHELFDFELGPTTLKCNPLGYKGEGINTEIKVATITK